MYMHNPCPPYLELDLLFKDTRIFFFIFDVCVRIFIVIGQVAMTLTDDGNKTKPCKIIRHLPTSKVSDNIVTRLSCYSIFFMIFKSTIFSLPILLTPYRTSCIVSSICPI